MLYAKKSNRVLPVTEELIQQYLNQGYTIIDSKGTILIESMPDDVAGLKAAFKRHTDEIAKLKEFAKEQDAQMVVVLEANARLSAENDELKTALEQAKKAQATKTTKAKKAKDAEVVAETAEDASDE